MSDKNMPTGKHTLVEDGTELKGTMTSSCPIVVMGKIEGDITAPITRVTPTGVVAGKVKVTELTSEGEVAGEVEAETVRISGRVRDRTVIRARTLEVKLESKGMEVRFGECEFAVGDEPNKEAAIAAASGIMAPSSATTAEASAPSTPSTSSSPSGPPGPPGGSSSKNRKKGMQEASVDEVVSAIEPPDAEGGTRRRGTQPPPIGS